MFEWLKKLFRPKGAVKDSIQEFLEQESKRKHKKTDQDCCGQCSCDKDDTSKGG